MKQLKDCTFQEVIDNVTWNAITQLVNGISLRSVISGACMTSLSWQKEQEEKQKELKREKRKRTKRKVKNGR